MISIIGLTGKRPDKLDPAEIQLIKDFIIGASRNINEKILNLEADHHVNIKLAPLPKKVVNVRQGDPLMSFPIMTTAHVNTGLHGSFKYPNTVNVNVPFLLDPIGGNGGENYKQRLNKMLEYIKIYKIVKTQLEAYKASITPTSNPDDIKKARSKVSSQYVEFLPDTVEDKENIEKYEDSAFTEDDIESIAKQILNPTNPLSSPPATPPATATATSTTVRAPVTASIRAPAPAPAPVPVSATLSIRGPSTAPTSVTPIDKSILDKETNPSNKQIIKDLCVVYEKYITMDPSKIKQSDKNLLKDDLYDKLKNNDYSFNNDVNKYLFDKFTELINEKGI